VLLTSCSFAPDYERPFMEIPTQYKEEGEWVLADPEAASLTRDPWWEKYEDPQLNELVEALLLANQDLKLAIARYDQAKALADIQRSFLFPTITALAVPSRQNISQNIANPARNSPYNDLFLGFDLSYELDVWGQVRNTVLAADNEAKASEVDIAAIELSLQALLTSYYFSLRGADLAQITLEGVVKAYEEALYLYRKRYEGGAAPLQAIFDTQVQVESAKTYATDMQLIRAQYEHAIAVLIGKTPAELDIPVIADATQKVVMVAPELPSTLLERRPDIAAAELRVQEANATIGVARAAYFPTFNLFGSFGVESTKLSNLFNVDSLVWSLGPGAGAASLGTVIDGPPIIEIITDGGEIAALNRNAWAIYHEAVATYRQTVLKAFQEVEDSLVSMRKLAEEDLSQTAATKAAIGSVDQALHRYQGGLTTYLDVVIVEDIALQNQLRMIDIRTRHQIASVQLIKALGGGWSELE